MIDLGRTAVDPTGVVSYQSFYGFAADGVARIGVVDSKSRRIPVTEVVDNVFYADEPPPDAKRVYALDADGDVVWERPEARIFIP